MSNAQHTPGPWKAASNGSSAKIVDAEGKAICMITPRAGAWNGNVLAEAPAMLEALHEIESLPLDDYGYREIPPGFLDGVRAILARIDGKEG